MTSVQLTIKNDPVIHLLLGDNLQQFTIDPILIFEINYYCQYPIIFQSGNTLSESTDLDAVVTEDITTFHDSRKSPNITSSFQATPMTKTIISTMNHDIKSFLARPLIISDGSVSASNIVGVLLSGRIAAILRNNPIYQDKLKGVYSLRYTTVLTLKINATRFQAGCLMLCWIPTGGATDPQHAIRVPINFSDRNQYSQTMHVKADFAYDSSVTLRIPFVSPKYSCAYTSDPPGNPGNWAVYLYSPLNFMTGSNVVPYTLYSSFEDVELFGAVVPQSNLVLDKSSSSKRKKKDLYSREMVSEKPISGSLKFAAEVSKTISSIPFFAPFAAPASYVLEAASGVAALFGYSNPRVISKPMRIISEGFPYSCNNDGGNLSIPLGLSVSSHVGVINGFAGLAADEMSVDFLKCRYGHFRSANWTTSQVDGTVLIDFNLNPTDMFVQSLTGAGFSLTPIGYLGRTSKFWTGGMKIKVHMFKTPFHSGRLAIIATPLTDYPGVPLTLDNISYVSKAIIDITDYNVIEVTVPWLSVDTWLPTSSSMANFKVMILDQLVAPGDVGTSIALEIEVCGADDFQIAGAPSVRFSPAVAQSGLSLDADLLQVELGESTSTQPDYQKNSDCIGETFLSIKNYITPFRAMGPEFTLNENTYGLVKPFAFSYKAAGANITGQRDPLNFIALIYGLYRGSMNITAYSDTANPHQIVASLDNSTVSRPMTQVATVRATTIELLVSRQSLISRGHLTPSHVNIPFYNTTPSSPTSDHLYNASVPVTNLIDDSPVIIFSPLVNTVTATAVRTIIYRSGGDDLQFGLFMSIPIMVLT